MQHEVVSGTSSLHAGRSEGARGPGPRRPGRGPAGWGGGGRGGAGRRGAARALRAISGPGRRRPAPASSSSFPAAPRHPRTTVAAGVEGRPGRAGTKRAFLPDFLLPSVFLCEAGLLVVTVIIAGDV